jgi:hypothetical protein
MPATDATTVTWDTEGPGVARGTFSADDDRYWATVTSKTVIGIDVAYDTLGYAIGEWMRGLACWHGHPDLWRHVLRRHMDAQTAPAHGRVAGRDERPTDIDEGRR